MRLAFEVVVHWVRKVELAVTREPAQLLALSHAVESAGVVVETLCFAWEGLQMSVGARVQQSSRVPLVGGCFLHQVLLRKGFVVKAEVANQELPLAAASEVRPILEDSEGED